MSEPPYGPPDPSEQPAGQQNPYDQAYVQPPNQQPYQPPQPYAQLYAQPYAQPGYPMPHGSTPPEKNNTTRNVLLIVGAVVLLFCGGIVALFTWIFMEAGDAIENGLEGEAFTFDDIDFADGWELQSEGELGSNVSDLRATNPAGGTGTNCVSIDVRLLEGDDILAEISCSSRGSIGEGQSKLLTCTSSDALPPTYDSISIDDY